MCQEFAPDIKTVYEYENDLAGDRFFDGYQ